MTWEEFVVDAAKKLEDAGIDDPHANAEYLASHLMCGKARYDWRKHRSLDLDSMQAKQYQELVERRLRREPLQYILGEWEFFGLPILVGPGVLIPRPETEILVEEALKEASAMPTTISIVDAGTGSGAIALSLATKLPQATVIGIDVSDVALDIARKNQKRLQIKNVIFEVGNMLSGDWLGSFESKIDLLASNPPYVSIDDFHSLDPELRLFEPREALTDNADGLTFYKTLVKNAARLLAPNGRLLLELGYNVCDDVIQITRAGGLQVGRVVKDLAGVDRVLVAECTKS